MRDFLGSPTGSPISYIKEAQYVENRTFGRNNAKGKLSYPRNIETDCFRWMAQNVENSYCPIKHNPLKTIETKMEEST